MYEVVKLASCTIQPRLCPAYSTGELEHPMKELWAGLYVLELFPRAMDWGMSGEKL